MAKAQRVGLDEVIGYFDDLEDPRGAAGGPTAIARWAALKAELLAGVLPLPNGIPRKDVFRRVLSLLQPAAFQACFANWLQSLRATAAAATGVDRPVFAVDGKTARRS